MKQRLKVKIYFYTRKPEFQHLLPVFQLKNILSKFTEHANPKVYFVVENSIKNTGFEDTKISVTKKFNQIWRGELN